jgi:phospholipid/cholesterol/gamma-HCH transport system substrate-binding protein
MNRMNVEMVVGVFLLAGFISFSWLAVKMGDINPFENETYPVTARFTSISGLKEGSTIELAGVIVGKVNTIELDTSDYEAVVHLDVDKTVELQDDTIASIRTSGIIGDKYIKLTPGGSDIILEAGGEIEETEPSISLEELVSKYIFDSK